MGRRKVPVRGGVALVALVVALVACSAEGDDETASSPAPTVSSTPSPEPEPEPEVDADEEEILAVFDAYWEASVEAQRGNPDPGLFEDNATGVLVEKRIMEAQEFEEFGIVREGEPGFSETSVAIDGDSALVSSCIDYTTWVVPEVEDDLPDVVPIGTLVERIDGTWLVTEITEASAELTC